MRIVNAKELSGFKILPYDLYDESSHKVLTAGEVLTPGKLIMLKNYPKLYTEDLEEINIKGGKNSANKNNLRKLANFSYDTLDTSDFETVVNKENTLKVETQIKIKYYFKKTMELLTKEYYEEGSLKLHSLTSILISDIFKQFKKTEKGSQIRFLGEYELCHPLNVAIICGLIANKLEYSNTQIENAILAGLLHDIGKLKMSAQDKSVLLALNEDEITNHTEIGYEMIKENLKLPEEVAKVALEHHENNDGSGYPHGLSSDYISELAQIVNVANFYDNLACNRTPYHIKNNRDALRIMLEVGTKKFSARMLYTFIHMFKYNDSKDFNDMLI